MAPTVAPFAHRWGLDTKRRSDIRFDRDHTASDRSTPPSHHERGRLAGLLQLTAAALVGAVAERPSKAFEVAGELVALGGAKP